MTGSFGYLRKNLRIYCLKNNECHMQFMENVVLSRRFRGCGFPQKLRRIILGEDFRNEFRVRGYAPNVPESLKALFSSLDVFRWPFSNLSRPIPPTNQNILHRHESGTGLQLKEIPELHHEHCHAQRAQR